MDTQQEKQAPLLLSKARVRMLRQHPFYGYILTKLPCILDESIPTVGCTDYHRVRINPTRFAKLSNGERLTVLAHEQMHVLENHRDRIPSGDPFLVNLAGDIRIYFALQQDGFDTLQENKEALEQYVFNIGGWQLEDDFITLTFEQAYAKLAAQRNRTAAIPNPLGCYEEDAPGDSTEGSQAAQAEWKQTIREAGQFATRLGTKPGAWSELVKATEEEVPFETHLYEFLRRGLGGEATFDHLNRRSLAQGLYLPSETIEEMGETVIAVDTSGSINEAALSRMLGIIRAWREEHPCMIHVVGVDSEVQQWLTFEEHDSIPAKIEFAGRGGTNFDPVFKEIATRHLEPALLIYLTDSVGPLTVKSAPFPVLWALTDARWHGFHPAFGQIVKAFVQR